MSPQFFSGSLDYGHELFGLFGYLGIKHLNFFGLDVRSTSPRQPQLDQCIDLLHQVIRVTDLTGDFGRQ